MKLWTRLFLARGMRSQQLVAQRTAHVIDRVMFDIGAQRMLQGTMLLDRRLRPRFCGGCASAVHKPLAAVALASLAGPAGPDAVQDLQSACTELLLEGVLREFRRQSPRFQSLP